METLIPFIKENWILAASLLVVLLLFIQNELRSMKFGSKSVDPQTLTLKLNHDKAVLVDIRKQDAFLAGHITQAINLPQADLMSSTKKIQRYKSQPIILICQAGQICPKVSNYLVQQGFSEVYFLQGGMNAWKEANMPLAI